jgi:DNA polymerase
VAPHSEIDFETRSAAKIKNTGSWRYSCDPTTEVLCLAFRLPHWPAGETALWHPAFPQFEWPEEGDDKLTELFWWILDGGLIEAHNAWFERGIWQNIMIPRYGWIDIPATSWRCSAAKAASHALPRKLDEVGNALGLDVVKQIVMADVGVRVQKNVKLVQKLGKPRKVRKAERAKGIPADTILYHESRAEFEQLFAYCRQDVLAEEAVSDALPDLSPYETRVYLLDQTINEYGVRLDRTGVEAARTILAAQQTTLNAELDALTHGAVPRASCRAKLQRWCQARGVTLPDTTKETVTAILDNPQYHKLQDTERRVLEILRTLGQSSTAKYERMAAQICPDDRAHGQLLYHGASTGRWTGAGIQPQNFPRGTCKDFDMDLAWGFIHDGDAEGLGIVWGDVMAALAHALRGAFIPSDGQVFYVADYAGIEARVLLWLAEDEDGLDIFRSGRDIYCEMASTIYDRPITKADKDERQLGKVAILGLGYQMGAPKFVDTAATYGITLELSQSYGVVEAYRERFERVKQFWSDMEQAALLAVENPGIRIQCGLIAFLKSGRFLYMILPSGRRLAYCDPLIQEKTLFRRSVRQLSFMGVNPLSKKWQRQSTYGGSLVENAVQAVARDLMADAFLRCADTDMYQPVLTVHDELIAEGPPGLPVKAFEALVATNPPWADGCPVSAEGWSGARYRKA